MEDSEDDEGEVSGDDDAEESGDDDFKDSGDDSGEESGDDDFEDSGEDDVEDSGDDAGESGVDDGEDSGEEDGDDSGDGVDNEEVNVSKTGEGSVVQRKGGAHVVDFRNYGNGIIYRAKNVKSIKELVKNILRNNSDVHINDTNTIFRLLNVTELEGSRSSGVSWYSGLFVYKALVLVASFVVLL